MNAGCWEVSRLKERISGVMLNALRPGQYEIEEPKGIQCQIQLQEAPLLEELHLIRDALYGK